MSKVRWPILVVTVALLLIAPEPTAQAQMVSGWYPRAGQIMTLQFIDEAGNIIVAEVTQPISWELGTEDSPKFVRWDANARFTVKTPDGRELSLSNAAVKTRIRKVFRAFAPAGLLSGNILDLTQVQPTVTPDGPYQGVSECPGMRAIVTFTYDRVASLITGFSKESACAAGGTHSLWKVEQAIRVQADGSFFHEDRSGNSVTGKIGSDGKASGTFSPAPFRLMCKDGSFLPECTSWTASPTR